MEEVLRAGAGRRELSGIAVFDPSPDHAGAQPPDQHTLRVDAGATRAFGFGFDAFSYEPRFGETVTVGVRMRVGAQVLAAKSPLRYVRRWPLGTE